MASLEKYCQLKAIVIITMLVLAEVHQVQASAPQFVMADPGSQKTKKHVPKQVEEFENFVARQVESIVADQHVHEKVQRLSKHLEMVRTTPTLVELTKRIGQTTEVLSIDPKFQELAKAFVHPSSKSAKPSNVEQTQRAARKMKVLMADTTFQAQAKRVAEQIEAMQADPQVQEHAQSAINQMETILSDPILMEHAKLVANRLEVMMGDVKFRKMVNASTKHMEGMKLGSNFQEQRLAMMADPIIGRRLRQATHDASDLQFGSLDLDVLADNLVDKCFGQPQVWLFLRGDLDDATLGKGYQFASGTSRFSPHSTPHGANYHPSFLLPDRLRSGSPRAQHSARPVGRILGQRPHSNHVAIIPCAKCSDIGEEHMEKPHVAFTDLLPLIMMVMTLASVPEAHAAVNPVESAFAAYGHYLGLFIMVGALATERWSIKPNMTQEEELRLVFADATWGLAGLLAVYTGYLRVIAYGKGWEFYEHEPIFWVKLWLFAVIGASSLFPTIKIIQRAVTAAFKAQPLDLASWQFEPMSDKLANRLTTIVNGELLGMFSIPLAATLMARGVYFQDGLTWPLGATPVALTLAGLGYKYVNEALSWEEEPKVKDEDTKQVAQ